MKKWLLGILASSAILVSCKESAPIDYLPYVVGQWVCNEVNYGPLATDSVVVINFSPGFKYSEAYGVPQSDGGMRWFETADDMTFQVVGHKILISSLVGAKDPKFIKLNIEYISGTYMTYSVDEYIVNGVRLEVPQTFYTLEKSIADISGEIVGVWAANVAGSSDQWIWDIKEGGKYDFYIYDPINKVYKEQFVDKSYYKLYGRYIVTIFSHSVVAGESTGVKADVWQISLFDYASMLWTARKQDGKQEMYSLINIGKLP